MPAERIGANLRCTSAVTTRLDPPALVAKDAAAAVAQKPHFAGAMGGKPRSRDNEKVQRSVYHQKQREGKTPNGATLKGAERRASRRAATNPAKLERVQDTMGSADVAVRKHLENWQDPEISVAELEDVYDQAFARRLATHTASLRDDAAIEKFAARVADSSAGAAANVLSRKAGAKKKRTSGSSRTYTYPRITGAGKLKVRRCKIVRTGAQVKKKELRDRMIAKLPANLRPTFKTQTLAPGSGLIKKRAAGRSRVVKRTHARGPPPKRSRAEVYAQALSVRPLSRGQYRFVILSSAWSDPELRGLGFRPYRTPKRQWDFKGPTAKDDAEAFAKKMMEWLENPNRDGPPPQP